MEYNSETFEDDVFRLCEGERWRELFGFILRANWSNENSCRKLPWLIKTVVHFTNGNPSKNLGFCFEPNWAASKQLSIEDRCRVHNFIRGQLLSNRGLSEDDLYPSANELEIDGVCYEEVT